MIEIKKVSFGIYRGPQPRTPDDWRALKALGVEYCLDLESGSHLMGDGHPLFEQLTSASFGIKTYCHPLGEILPPTQDELNAAVSVMHEFHPIYVHCRAGVDRTGMVCAAWRMAIEKWTKAQAVKECKVMGMHLHYYWWTWFL